MIGRAEKSSCIAFPFDQARDRRTDLSSCHAAFESRGGGPARGRRGSATHFYAVRCGDWKLAFPRLARKMGGTTRTERATGTRLRLFRAMLVDFVRQRTNQRGKAVKQRAVFA